MHIVLETGHKFDFSFLKENISQTLLRHDVVCLAPSVTLKGFLAAPLTLWPSQLLIMDIFVNIHKQSSRAFSFC